MAETISAVLQMKRMTREQWRTSQYIPKQGEPVCESDTGFMKVGDGTHRFPDLRYLTGPQGQQGTQGIQGPPGRDGVVTFENLSTAQRASLKGDRGEPGPRGLQGPPGPAGARGADGARGANGERGHVLTANVRMEGTYRNSVTNDVKIFVEVYYDGQKVTNGFNLKIKHKGGNNTDWGGFFTRTYTVNGEVLNYDWGNSKQNGTPLEVIVVIEYQGMSTTASTRLENVQDGLPINENLIPDSDIANGYSKLTWEDKVTNSGLQLHTGHAVNNLGRGLHVWGTPNAEYKGLSTAPFPLVAKRGDKVTLSMDLGKDALREDSSLRFGIHYMNGTNQIVAQEWQDLDLATQGFEIRKYKRISRTFTVGSDITYCRVMIYATAGRLINFYIDNIKLERGEVATAWCPAYADLRGATYRIAKGDISGTGVGAVVNITTNDLLNSDGVKVGDMISDWWSSQFGADSEFWIVTAVNGTTVTVKNLVKRTFPTYDDSEVKRRITTLENRPAPTGFVNQKTGQAMKYWLGSKAEFDAISNKDANTVYDYYE